jgi:capsid protein
VIDVDRLSNPHGMPETDVLKGGVELDRLGAPLAYHVRNTHPGDHTISMRNPSQSLTWTRVPRETPWRRMVMSHSYQRVRAGQTRGVSEFASAIVALKMGHEYHEMDLRFNGAKIPKLAPGDKLDIVGSKHPTSGYQAFVRSQIHGVAAGLGVDPIALSQDYSSANYASNKMSFAHNGRAAETRRARLVRMIAMPMFASWLEEAISKAYVAMPKGLTPDQFYAARDALVRGSFITSSRALIEPMKERQAQQLGRTIGVETLESICGEEGESWEDNLEQIARENALATELGLTLPGMLPMLPVEEVAEDETDENGDEKKKEPA